MTHQHRISFEAARRASQRDALAICRRILPGGKIIGREYIARNPNRNDRTPGSFKINLETCYWADFATGDSGGDLISLVAYLTHVSQIEAVRLLTRELKDLTVSPRSDVQADPAPETEGGIPSTQRATVQPLGCTLAAYAEDKALPEPFLRELGLSEITYRGGRAVRIPYRDANGREHAIRYRTALRRTKQGDSPFSWRKGSKSILYGLWRLQPEKSIVTVEGESDCHTLWLHGINAVGLPGASNWNESRDAQHLADCETIYVLLEPDEGGKSMLSWIGKSVLRNHVFLIRLDGFKDASDMHVADPERFQERWQAALESAQPWAEHFNLLKDEVHNKAWAACQELAREPDILSRFVTDLLRAGAVGVEHPAKLLFLATTSRVLNRPISIAIKGQSASGKSHLVTMVLSFFPPEAYYAVTAMSERALAYGEESLKNRMLVLYEAEGMSSELASYLIRSLLSEGRIRYETVEKTPYGMQSRLIEREGPMGLIVTTTRDLLHPENETRLLSLTLADSQEQTRVILDALANEDWRDEVDRKSWIALQRWISSSDPRVTIPFARTLTALIPPIAVRLRRDGMLLLNLIRSHALLHQASRERDEVGRVIATLQDYAAVYALVAEFMAEGAQTSIPVRVRETVEVVEQIAARCRCASVQEVAKALKLDKSAASRRCQTAQASGYIRNEETSTGRPAQYVLANPLPAEQPLLPHPDVLAAALCKNALSGSGCTVAGGAEG